MDAEAAPDTDNPSCAGGRFELLARINAREQEIERLLHEARESADERLLEARRTAAVVIKEHEQEAASASALAEAELLAQARGRAEAIRSEGEALAAAIRAVPPERIERAAEQLLSLILPSPPQDGPGP